jgi:hypothetical protein
VRQSRATTAGTDVAGDAPYIHFRDAAVRRLDLGLSVQILELVIFAALAAIVLFNLYAVLGRRVGRQPNEASDPAGARVAEGAEFAAESSTRAREALGLVGPDDSSRAY